MRRLLVAPPLSLGEAADRATPEERLTASRFAPARAREYLSWRALVRRETGPDTVIAYNAAGAPQLPGCDLRLSVSHCRGRIAIALSDRPCALDIEELDRNYERVLFHYLTPGEIRLSADPRYPAIAWCTKETLYKFACQQAYPDTKRLDLLRDLRIEAFRFLCEEATLPEAADPANPVDLTDLPASGRLEARIRGGAPLTLDFHLNDRYALVHLFAE